MTDLRDARVPDMVIDHIGIVVRSIKEGTEHWRQVFGYEAVTEAVVNTRQKVRVIFLRKSGSVEIKLIEPIDESSPVSTYAKRGGGLHHLCLRCDSVDRELARLNALGLRTLRPPEPGEAFEDERIASYDLDGFRVTQSRDRVHGRFLSYLRRRFGLTLRTIYD